MTIKQFLNLRHSCDIARANKRSVTPKKVLVDCNLLDELLLYYDHQVLNTMEQRVSEET